MDPELQLASTIERISEAKKIYSIDFFYNVNVVPNLPIWEDIFAFCDVVTLGSLAQVCLRFLSFIKGYSIKFSDNMGEFTLPNITLGYKDFTFFANVKPTSDEVAVTRHAPILCIGDIHKTYTLIRLELDKPAHVMVTDFSKIQYEEVKAPHSLPLNEFTRVCMVREGCFISIYYNGIKEISKDTKKIFIASCSFCTGWDPLYLRCFPGEIKGARLWLQALPDNTIASLV